MDLTPTRRAKDARAAADGFRNVAFWSCPARRREATEPVGGTRQSSGWSSWGDVAEKAVQPGGISGDVSVVQKRSVTHSAVLETPRTLTLEKRRDYPGAALVIH